jgi:predicted MPP superfamily phosphohydrolase
MGAMGASAGFYAWRIEPHWVEIVRFPMPLANLPPSLEGRTLLHLSDLHVGPGVDSQYLIEAFQRAAALAPDFVALTGDFVSYGSAHEVRELVRVLRHLPLGRLGTLAALGNPDYGPGWRHVDVADRIARAVSDAGAAVLRNGACETGGVQFAGLADFWSPEFGAAPRKSRVASDEVERALSSLDRNRASIVLCHNPDVVDLPIWSDFEGWVLSGHTHGGQVRPPFLPPPIIPVRNKRYTAGVFDVGQGRSLYINRGLGHLLPVRFNVRPEMTLFTFEAARPRNKSDVNSHGRMRMRA